MSIAAPTATRALDTPSRPWLQRLRSEGWARDAAIRRLRALLLGEARHEVRRRTAAMTRPSGRDLDELAVQAADDALIATAHRCARARKGSGT